MAARLYAEEIERLKLLVEASSTLLGSLTVQTVLPKVLDLAQRTLAADAYALWQYDEESGSWGIAIQSGLPDDYVGSAVEAIRGNTARVSFEEPIVAEEIATTEWLTPEHRQAHAAAGTKSLLAVALGYGGRVLGMLAFYYRHPHRFAEAEKNAASLLANLAAAAVGAANLYEAQQHLAEDHKFVAQASELLASSLDYETTLTNVATLAVPRFADWCSIDMVQEDGSVGRLTVAHVDPDKVRWANKLAKKYPPDPDATYGVPNVIRTARPEFFAEIPDELLVEATDGQPELLEILRKLGLKSSMCVPLVARDRALGAITFVSAESGRRYDEADLVTAQDLARRVALAVDNALLFREAEAARRQAQESLAVVDATLVVSHELRTPLAAIYGAALTLRRDDVPLGEPQRAGLLEVIASESDRLARIVNDVLWASRLESGGMTLSVERCDGVELARSVIETARQYVPPSIEITFSAPKDAPMVSADPDKARQVLTNLVDNAVKYSPDGGRVNVEISVAGSNLRFSVRDEGLGVPPAEHRRIFEKFYRLDPDLTRGVGGTGLGLYISRELLEHMGGSIWVESSGTGGSTFVAELPIAA